MGPVCPLCGDPEVGGGSRKAAWKTAVHYFEPLSSTRRVVTFHGAEQDTSWSCGEMSREQPGAELGGPPFLFPRMPSTGGLYGKEILSLM